MKFLLLAKGWHQLVVIKPQLINPSLFGGQLGEGSSGLSMEERLIQIFHSLLFFLFFLLSVILVAAGCTSSMLLLSQKVQNQPIHDFF